MSTQLWRENESEIFSSKALLDKLDHFEQQKPARMQDEFALAAVPSHEQLIAAKAGFNDTKYAYTAASHLDGDDKTREEEKKDEYKRRAFGSAMQTLNFDGIDISFDDVMKHMDTANAHYDQVMQENIEAIRVEGPQIAVDENGVPFSTREELDAWQAKQGDCSVVQVYAVEEVTNVDGHLVIADQYQEMVDANEGWEEQKAAIEEARAALARGEEIAPEMEKLIADIDRNGGEFPEPEAETEFSLVDELNAMSKPVEVNAYLQPEIKVVPTVTYSTPSPGG